VYVVDLLDCVSLRIGKGTNVAVEPLDDGLDRIELVRLGALGGIFGASVGRLSGSSMKGRYSPAGLVAYGEPIDRGIGV
jgi:hypothetical protein